MAVVHGASTISPHERRRRRCHGRPSAAMVRADRDARAAAGGARMTIG
jgi:hypothetical protein